MLYGRYKGTATYYYLFRYVPDGSEPEPEVFLGTLGSRLLLLGVG